jgi:hypothetical protein
MTDPALCPPPDEAEFAAIREKIIGARQPIARLARALNVCERSIYNVISRYRIPTVKFLGKQYADPAAIGAALLRGESNTAPRRPGRPKKAA